MINIVITMGGNGKRFREKGYNIPKYMIEVKNKTLFEWSMLSLENFKVLKPKYIFVVKKSDNAVEFIEFSSIKLGLENIEIIELDELTDGQATTALLAEDKWIENAPLLIYNIDTHIDPKLINPNDFIGDGFIPCFKGEGEIWSFVRLNAKGSAVEVKEKKRISDNATIGMYYFSTTELYKKAYNEYYKDKKNIEKGEKYIAPLYNYLIKEGYNIKISQLDSKNVYPLGIPDEVNAFEKNRYDYKTEEKKNIEIKHLLNLFIIIFLPLMFGILITSISLLILQPIMAQKYQVYNDIILENVSLMGSNKGGELFSFWISMLIGIVSMFLFKVIWDKYTSKRSCLYISNSTAIRLDFVGVSLIFIPILFNLIIKQNVNFYLLIIGIIYYVSYLLMNKKEVRIEKLLLLIFTIYFMLLSIKAVLDKIFQSRDILNEVNIYILLILLFFIIIFYLKKNNYKNIDRMILLFQIPVPLTLLTFLTERYLLKNKIYYIYHTNRYNILIITIMFILIALNIIQYKIKINKKSQVLVMFSSIVVVFILHYYIAPVYINEGDFWHHGEEMIQWHQIIEKKLKLYKEFSGTSGLYGLISGFFQNIVLQGTDASYFSARSLTNIFWAISTATLCYYLVGSNFALVLGMFIMIPSYNRISMIFFSLLILLLPKLIKSRVKWIQMYIILSIFSLFYYPLNGTALIVGVFPFSLIQLYLIHKEKILKKEIKSVSFWLLIAFIIFVLLKIFRTLFGLLNHMLLLSSQSKLADGTQLFNSSEPSIWFMTFLYNDKVKNEMWYMFIFTVIISCVLLYIYIIYVYLRSKNKENLFLKLQSQGFLLLSSSCIAVLINYTYTVIRMEINFELSRTLPTIVIFIGFLFNIFLYNYGDELFTKNIKIILIGLCVGFICTFQEIPFGKEINTIQRVYVVQENFEYIDGSNINISKLGKGFVDYNTIESIIITNELINKTVKKDEFFWPIHSREYLYIFNSITPTKIDSMLLTKSFKSSKENLKSVVNNPPPLIIGAVAYESYYVYQWILESGYIFYSYNGRNFWIRSDIYEKVFGNLEEAHQKMYDEFPQQNLYKIPYSLGNSMGTLNSIFSNKKIVNINELKSDTNQIGEIDKNKFQILETEDPFVIMTLPEAILGKDYDFMYLEISSNIENKILKNKKMQLFWSGSTLNMSENRSIRFDYGNGKLLIPVGVSLAWNFSDIKQIRIDFEGMKPEAEFEIKMLYFLKLNTKREEKNNE